MNFRSLTVLLLAAGSLLAVTGCSTFESRSKQKAAAFSTLDAATQARLKVGEIHLGEEDAVVLERLVESGRPERLTEPYVLDLFPPREEGEYCTYFEFSDMPRIFARLCFSESSGELVGKRKHDVFHPIRGEAPQGQVA